jgi:hypothetical protein
MFKRVSLLVFAVIALSFTGPAIGQKAPKILEFDTMVGVVPPFTGAANPIRGVNGGGITWLLTSGRGELKTDGHLEIQVRGLVLVTTGLNPQANFRAIVSCLTPDAGVAATVNVVTGQFPATPQGDADIEADLTLPSPCIAPIVFVTNGAGTSWFASTGG